MADKPSKSKQSILIPVKQLINQNETPHSNSRNNKSELSPTYFCTASNFQSALIYLSQELQNFGFNAKLFESNGEFINLVTLINCCWEILQLYHAAVRDGNSLHDQRCRDTADLNHLHDNVRGLKNCIEDKERLVQDAQERERQTNSINRALTSKLKTEKEEVRRLSSVLQQREAHHQHELRKREMENDRLKDRLHKLVSGDKTSDTRTSSINASTTLVRNDFSRGKWRTEHSVAKHEEELYRKVLNQYESWVSQLNDENEQLKECLSTTSSKIAKLSNQHKPKSPAINNFTPEGANPLCTSIMSTDSLDEPIFSVDFNNIRDEVQKNIDDGLQIITTVLDERGRADGTEVTEIPNDTEDIQQHIMDKKCTERFVPDGQCVEEEAILEKHRREFEEEKKSFDKERAFYTDAIIKLNRERAAFEAEKLALLKNQFLQELPENLSDIGDSPTITQRSVGSTSSGGSLSDLLMDSPSQRISSPSIIAAKGIVSMVRPSQPIILGPTRLPRNQREPASGPPTRNTSSHSLKRRSAPASRAPSIGRFDDGTDSNYGSLRRSHPTSPARPKEQPLSPQRSRKLERSSRLSVPGASSPHPSSKLQPKKSEDGIRHTSLPSRFSQCLSNVQVPIYSDDRHSFDRDSQHFFATSPETSFLPSRPASICSGESEPMSKDDCERYDRDDFTNMRLTNLENSLMDLLNQIAQRQQQSLDEDFSVNYSDSLKRSKDKSRHYSQDNRPEEYPVNCTDSLKRNNEKSKYNADMKRSPYRTDQMRYKPTADRSSMPEFSASFPSGSKQSLNKGVPGIVVSPKEIIENRRKSSGSRMAEAYYGRMAGNTSTLPARIRSNSSSRTNSRRSSLDRSPPRDFFQKVQRSILKK